MAYNRGNTKFTLRKIIEFKITYYASGIFNQISLKLLTHDWLEAKSCVRLTCTACTATFRIRAAWRTPRISFRKRRRISDCRRRHSPECGTETWERRRRGLKNR